LEQSNWYINVVSPPLFPFALAVANDSNWLVLSFMQVKFGLLVKSNREKELLTFETSKEVKFEFAWIVVWEIKLLFDRLRVDILVFKIDNKFIFGLLDISIELIFEPLIAKFED